MHLFRNAPRGLRWVTLSAMGATFIALPAGGAWGDSADPDAGTELSRIAVATAVVPSRAGSDPGLTCASLVISDGLSEALASTVGEWVLLDRLLVRSLERDQVTLGAEVVITPTIEAIPDHLIVVRVDQPPALATRVFRGRDPVALVDEIAVAVRAALGRPSSAAASLVRFPPVASCARLADALGDFDTSSGPALTRAISLLSGINRRAPNEPRVLAALAEAHVRAGELALGIALAESAIALAPEYPAAYWALGLAHDYAARPERALEAYREALNRGAGVLAAHVNAGVIELRAGRLGAALGHLEEAGARAPSWFVARFNLAAALVEAGDGNAALALLADIAPPARLAEESTLLIAAAYILARAPFRALPLLPPLTNHPRLGVRAKLLHARGLAATAEHDKALAELTSALETIISTPSLRHLRASLEVARVRALIALDRRDEGIEHLASLVAADAEVAEPLLHRALVALGGAEGANLEALTKVRPDDHETWFDLGVMRQRSGDLEGAASAYERALTLNPRAAWAIYNRGLVALSLGQVDAAISWLGKARTLDPSSHDIALALSAARARLAPEQSP